MSAEASIPSFTSLMNFMGTVYETSSVYLLLDYDDDAPPHRSKSPTVTLKRRPRGAGAMCHLDRRLCEEVRLISNRDSQISRYLLHLTAIVGPIY